MREEGEMNEGMKGDRVKVGEKGYNQWGRIVGQKAECTWKGQ